MPETRMDLNEAGQLLGVTANAVRARAKKGKIRYETDNSGKIWVFLDPDTVAPPRPPLEAPEPSLKDEMKVSNQAVIEALEGHIESLKSENEGLKTALADALRRLDLSEEERRKLVASLLEKASVPAPVPMVVPAPPAVAERPSWFSRLFGRSQ